MFITRIKLENFKGIFAGTGSKTIEIDFSEYERRLILLLGKNGSGKTTLLSCLHPFSETFDERSTIILDGCEGKKEIDILSGDDLYEITHIYGKKSKSFLYKNGVSINESGGIRTFIQLIETELGITPDFMKIIKIGSNAKNFIDLNSTARKTFLGNFTPSIEEFIAAYKIVNDKFNTSSKEIKYIADEINKIEKKEELSESISVKTKALKANQNNLNSLNAKLIALNTENDKIKEDLSEFDDELAERTLSIELKEKLTSELEEITSKYSSLKDKDKEFLKARLLKVSNEIKTIKEEISVNEKSLISFQEKKLAAVEKKKSAEANKKKMSSASLRAISNEKLEVLISVEKKKINTLKSSLKNPLFEGFDCSRVNVKSSEELYEFVAKSNKFGMNIIEAKSEIVGLFSDISEAESFLFSDKYDVNLLAELEKKKELTENKIVGAKDKLLSAKELFAASEATREVSSKCKNSSCEVFKIGLKELEKSSLVTKAENTLKSLEIELSEILDLIEKQSVLSRHRSLFHSDAYMFLEMEGEGIVQASGNLFSMLDLGTDFGSVLFNSPSEDISSLFNLNNLLKKWNLTNDLKTSIEKLEEYEERLLASKSSTDVLEGFQNEIDETSATISEFLEKESDLSVAIQEAKDLLDKKKSAAEILKDLIYKLGGLEKLSIELKTLDKVFKSNKDKLDRLVEIDSAKKETITNKELISELVDESSEELNNLKVKLARIEEYETRRDDLLTGRDKLKVIKESLDIKSGIPLHILGDYLGGIKDKANALLHKSLGEDFSIDFEISDTDFSIPVKKSGTIFAKDILECSQGETALVKSALSLGITSRAFEQNSKKYNIICLDEIDAELDSDNRYKFLDILQEQLDSLGNRQTFMITHNDAWNAADIGVVLMPGASLDTNDEGIMMNKFVIKDLRRKTNG